METPRQSADFETAGFEPPTPELETLVDLLVDGELPDAERRALLERLDATNGGWKLCAIAFLEAQTFRQAFRAFADADLSPLDRFADAATSADFADSNVAGRNVFSDFNGFGDPVATSRRDFPEPRIIPLNPTSRGGFRRTFGSDGSDGDGPRRPARIVATAAGFLLAFAFGALLYRQIAPLAPPFPPASGVPGPARPNGVDFAGTERSPRAPRSPRRLADSPIRYVTLRSPSRSLDDVAVPCVEGDSRDLAALRAARADVPPQIADAIRASGGRVQTVRDELRFPLDDGRTVVLPIDVYEIGSEFVPVCQ